MLLNLIETDFSCLLVGKVTFPSGHCWEFFTLPPAVMKIDLPTWGNKKPGLPRNHGNTLVKICRTPKCHVLFFSVVASPRNRV